MQQNLLRLRVEMTVPCVTPTGKSIMFCALESCHILSHFF